MRARCLKLLLASFIPTKTAETVLISHKLPNQELVKR